MAYGCDRAVMKLQAVVGLRAGTLVGEASLMKRAIQPLAAAVAGEHAARAVRAVCRGREADHDDARRRVAEPRHATAPVLLVAVRGAPFGGHLLAPGDEPFAAPALDDLGLHQRQRIHGGPR